MNHTTAENLRRAFGSKSMAHMRYLVWGEIAAQEGFANVSRLFRAIARSEQVHATNYFQALRDVRGDFLVPSMADFGIGNTSQNLEGAIAGENFEINQMYPAYRDIAKSQAEREAVTSFHYALLAERIHSQMYGQAQAAVEQGKDAQLGKIHICRVCGHTLQGNAPATCPICGASTEKYISFE